MAAERRLLGPNVAVLFGASQGKYPDGNTVIVCGRDGTLVIDPALSVRDEPETIVVDRVLLTHPHEDHVAGLSAVRHAVVQVHRDDLGGLTSLDGLMRLYGIPESGWPAMTTMVQERFHVEARPDAVPFDHGDEWDLGGVVVRAIAAPGHTAGHQSLWVRTPAQPTFLLCDAAYLIAPMRGRRLPGVLWSGDAMLDSWDRIEAIERCARRVARRDLALAYQLSQFGCGKSPDVLHDRSVAKPQ